MSDFFLNQNSSSNSNSLGTRLSNIKNNVITSQSVVGIQADNSTEAIPYTAFGKSLLNVSTLNGLVGLINTADTNVQVIDSGTGEINFTLDNALMIQVKNLYSQVLNELQTKNVKPITDLGSDLGDANKRYNVGYIRKITTNSVGQVSIGDGASTLGTSSVNIGNASGGSGTPDFSISIGRGANSEQSHTASICLGYASGQKGTAQRNGIIAIGHSAGTGISGVQGMLNNAIAIGSSASLNGGAVDSIAIGPGANGNSVANDYSVAIGSGAGNVGQGNHCIAIGRLAGQTNQHNSTIIINGQNNTALNSAQTGSLYIAPIRSGGTGNVLNYDTGSKEVLVGGVVSMSGISISGNINPDSTASNREIGASGNKFNNVYSTTFTGTLSGNATSSSYTSFIDSRYGTLTRPTATIAEFRSRLKQEINELCEAGAANTHLGVGNIWGVSKTIVPWTDPSGGRMYQYYYASNGVMYYRKSDNATPTEAWLAWRDCSPDKCLLTDSNDTITGTKTFSSNILSSGIGTLDIGSSGNPFGTIYGNNLNASNLVSNCKTWNLTPAQNNQYTIGASSTNQYNAIYGNNIYANGVSVSSDRRLKENIKPISNGLETVLKMNPVEYKMKNGVRLHTGFLADEMAHLYNNEDWACFVEQKDEVKTQSLQYMEVIAILAKAIQDLNSKVVKIENRKLVGSSIIDTSGLTEDMTQIYERLDHLSTKVSELENQPVKPQLHRCVELSRINELYHRITNLELNETKDSNSEDIELIHSLMEKVNFLELKNRELESKIERLPKIVESKSSELLESDGGLNINEMLQQKNFELETRLIKLEKQNKRLVQAVNKLLKSNDV